MGFLHTKISAFSPEKYQELNSGIGKIRNKIAAFLYERPNNIKKRQDKFNLLRNFFYKRLAFFIGNRAFNRKMELISQEQQVQRAIITNKDIIEDLNKIMLRVQENSISEDELFKFFAEKTCVWTDLAATAIFKTVILPDNKNNPEIKTGKRLKFQLVAQGIHPNKNNYRAYEWASGAAKLLGKDSYIFILEKYLRLKEKGLGKEGVFARLVFDVESYYVESQRQMPFDMYVSNNEEDVISLTDPLSSGGVPTGRIPEIGYAAGGILFSHDDDSKGHIKSKGYVLETLAELIGAIIQKSDKQVILDGLVNLLAVLSDYHIRESFNREQAAHMKLMQMSGPQAKVLYNTKDLKSLKEGVKVDAITMFADLVSFTTKSNTLWSKYDAKGVFKFPNMVFNQVGPIVPSLGAYVDKFGGDQLMIKIPNQIDKDFFSFLHEDMKISEGEMSGIATFLTERILNQIDSITVNPEGEVMQFLLDIDEPLGMRIGYGFGSTAYGLVGFGDMDSPFARYDLTSISPAVNLSARLESAAHINNALYNDEIFETLSKLEISSINTPFLWMLIQHDPYLTRVYGEILRLNQKMKFYELKLESFNRHHLENIKPLYAGLKIKDLVKMEKKKLKGFSDLVPVYHESHLRNNPNHALERLYHFSKLTSDKLGFVVESLRYLFQMIRNDQIAQAWIEKYLDQQVFKHFTFGEVNEIKDVIFFRISKEGPDANMAYSQLAEWIQSRNRKLKPALEFIKENQ